MEKIDFLFVHVPKRANYYKPLDEFMLINYIPVGVLMLADLLNKAGYSSRVLHLGLETIIDPNYSVVQWVKDKEIKVVGLPIHWHYQSFDAIDVAQKIKKVRPDIHITLGGFTASRFAEEILDEFPEIDSVVQGDGEKAVVQILEAIYGDTDFSTVQNLVWKSNSSIRNNKITFVADEVAMQNLDYTNFDLLFHAHDYVQNFSIPLFWMKRASVTFNRKIHFNNSKIFPLPVGRGCSVNCSFCGGSRDTLEKISGRRVPVFRPIADVIQSIKGAIKVGYTSLNVCFDPYPAKFEYWQNLFYQIKKEQLSVDMFFECWGLPVREFIDAFAKTFRGKGSAVAISAESGCDTIRKLNKGIPYSNEQLFETLDYLLQKKVSTYMYFTMGLAGETKEDLQKTKSLISTIRKKYKQIIKEILLVPIQLEPGAPMFERPSDYKIRTNRASFIDFYNSHKSFNSDPYSSLCYSSMAMMGEEASEQEFSEYILKRRCEEFCVIQPKLFGKELPNAGKYVCKFRHSFWKRKGGGNVPEVRECFE